MNKRSVIKIKKIIKLPFLFSPLLLTMPLFLLSCNSEKPKATLREIEEALRVLRFNIETTPKQLRFDVEFSPEESKEFELFKNFIETKSSFLEKYGTNIKEF